MNKAVKHDGDKPRTDLLPPSSLMDTARVMGFGATKYGEDNYLRGDGLEPRRLVGAAMRHLLQHLMGEAVDAESGLPHLAHAAASCLMALEVVSARGRGRHEQNKGTPTATVNRRVLERAGLGSSAEIDMLALGRLREQLAARQQGDAEDDR